MRIVLMIVCTNLGVHRHESFESSENRPIPLIGDEVMFDASDGSQVNGRVIGRTFSFLNDESPSAGKSTVVNVIVEGAVF